MTISESCRLSFSANEVSDTTSSLNGDDVGEPNIRSSASTPTSLSALSLREDPLRTFSLIFLPDVIYTHYLFEVHA